MKIVDCDRSQEKKTPAGSLDDLMSSLSLRRVPSQAEAETVVINTFQRVLDNKYVLLRNVLLVGLELPIPMLLVGPPGIWMIYPSALRGVYRAQGDTWEKIDERKPSYRATGESLLTRAVVLTQALEARLAENGEQNAKIDTALVFTNPGIHIESIRPVVRIVQVDAIERFVSSIAQGRSIYDAEHVQGIVDLLSAPPEYSDRADLPAGDNLKGLSGRGVGVLPGTERLERIDQAFSSVEKLPFSSRQWIILGVLILINILILVGFVIYILFAN